MSNVLPLPVGGELVTRVAANVRAECARRGFNQSDLARALGWAVSTVQVRWSGARQWQLEDLEQVALILGIPAELLFARPEGLEPPTFWSVVMRAVRRAFGGTGRAGLRGAASGPAAPVYSIETGERVA